MHIRSRKCVELEERLVSQDAVIENAIEMNAASIDERTKAQDEKVIFPN